MKLEKPEVTKAKMMGLIRAIVAGLGGVLILLPGLEGVDFDALTDGIVIGSGVFIDLGVGVWSWRSKNTA